MKPLRRWRIQFSPQTVAATTYFGVNPSENRENYNNNREGYRQHREGYSSKSREGYSQNREGCSQNREGYSQNREGYRVKIGEATVNIGKAIPAYWSSDWAPPREYPLVPPPIGRVEPEQVRDGVVVHTLGAIQRRQRVAMGAAGIQVPAREPQQ
eukprot:4450316-Pyramimonas_sp.AAC.1